MRTAAFLPAALRGAVQMLAGLRWGVPLVLAALAGCKRAPAGACPFDLGGVWVNASDERYGYRLDDRGERITGEFFLRQPDGKAAARAPGEQPITFALRRTPAEVAGTMRSPARTPSGKECLVDFAVKIASCQPDGMQVQAELSAPLTEACERLRSAPDGGPIRPDIAEYTWVRPKGAAR